jgi:hypothetical protein
MDWTDRKTVFSESKINPVTKLDPKAKLAIEDWDLPYAIVKKYKSIGIANIFEWQAECLLTGTALGLDLFSNRRDKHSNYSVRLVGLKATLFKDDLILKTAGTLYTQHQHRPGKRWSLNS